EVGMADAAVLHLNFHVVGPQRTGVVFEGSERLAGRLGGPGADTGHGESPVTSRHPKPWPRTVKPTLATRAASRDHARRRCKPPAHDTILPRRRPPRPD